ncbi:MAG: DNA methyltransferase [Dehalococcoidia bacterium]|nr:DNA methyltransferase [Dehalococcoidia bacterium]
MSDQIISERYALYCGDCMETIPKLRDGSIHLSLYSPPFAGLYNYTSDERDFSNVYDYDEFLRQYGYLVRELHRVTIPGRVTAVHCADIPTGNTGRDRLRDFSGDIIRLHEQNGWYFTARYCIWKDPFEVYLRTLAKNLRHRSMVEDSARCTNAAADYLLIFRKKGENPIPIAHPEGLLRYIGARQVPTELLKFRGWQGKQTENKFSQWVWRQYASAFWDDIRVDNVLPFRDSKEPDDERHVHPLQLDVIERAVILWSNANETVLTPFMGVGSEVYGTLVNGRRGIGIELKASYYRQAKLNVEAALTTPRDVAKQGTFDIIVGAGAADPWPPEADEAATGSNGAPA